MVPFIKILKNENLYDIMQIIGCLGGGIMRRWGRWITKGYKETWGDKYVHHLKCGDTLLSVSIC